MKAGPALAVLVLMTSAVSMPSSTVQSAPKHNDTIDSKAYRLEHGEVRVLQIPVQSTGPMLQKQTCFLWRDDQYKTTSLQCPNDRSTFTIEPD